MTQILLDTHAFIWIATNDPRLGSEVARIYLQDDYSFFLSVASLWEMAIKTSLGRLELEMSLTEIVRQARLRQGIQVLPIAPEHAMHVADLPFHHRDPFDRLLIAQALLEGLTMATRDPSFDEYGVDCVWDSTGSPRMSP